MIVLGNGYIELEKFMGTDLDVVNAARVSRGEVSEVFGDRRLLAYLWKNKHTSPFEFVEFTFIVKAPLFVVRQWQRHRTWSYCETSRRYTKDNVSFYYPEKWRFQDDKNKQASTGEFEDDIMMCTALINVVDTSFLAYNFLLGNGVCNEQARMALPQNMMVTFKAKVDLNNLLKFLMLRNDEHAQWEIQEYARAIEQLIEPIVPETMKLYRESKGVK